MGFRGPPQHLPFKALAVFASRLLALPIFRRFDPLSTEGEVVKRFCIDVKGVTATGESELTSILKVSLAAAQVHFATLSTSDKAALASKMHALKSAVSAVSCLDCAGETGHRCNGNEVPDSEQIDLEGVCLTVIRSLYQDATGVIEKALAQWVHVDGNIRPPREHRFGTEWSFRKEFQLPTGDWKVGAATAFEDHAGECLAQIELNLNVEEFDWASMLVVLWLFIHELFCHAYQVPHAGGAARKPCRTDCPFFEGWMDELAFWSLEAILVSAWIEFDLCAFSSQCRQELMQAANDYRSWRYGLGSGANRKLIAANWTKGAEAARAVRGFLEQNSASGAGTRKASMGQMLALSFRIQSATTDPEELRCIMSYLLTATTRPRGKSVRAALLVTLTGPIADKDLWINSLKAAAKA